MLRSHPSPGRARVGASLMFFTNGALMSALLPRLPEVKAEFGLTNSEFGLLVIAFPIGATIAAAVAAPLMRALGVTRVVAIGSVLLAAALAVAGTTPGVWVFAAAMVLGGAIDAVVDAGQNVQGVLVEQWRGRSIINSLHALWSMGAATGGLIGAAGHALEVDLGLQMLVNGAVWAAVAVLSCVLSAVPDDVRARLRAEQHAPAPARQERRDVRRHAWRLLVPLALLACCGTLIEDVANNWVVLYLGREADAPMSVAGLGVTVVLLAQFVGRLLGDPMTDRWGREAVARTGGLLIAVGAALAVLAPAYPLVFAGFALTGFGSATLVPAAFAAAGRIPGLPEGTGITAIGWLMRAGFLLTSPVIGWVSDLSSLRVAMLIPLGAGLAAALLSHAAARPRRPTQVVGPTV